MCVPCKLVLAFSFQRTICIIKMLYIQSIIFIYLNLAIHDFYNCKNGTTAIIEKVRFLSKLLCNTYIRYITNCYNISYKKDKSTMTKIHTILSKKLDVPITFKVANLKFLSNILLWRYVRDDFSNCSKCILTG